MKAWQDLRADHMSIDLSGVQLKLERAAQHLKALDEAAGPDIERDLDLRSDFDEEKNAHRVRYDGIEGNIPELGPLLGDFIHNTRSSLDHLVAAVLRSNNVRVRKYHSFPFCTSEEGFRFQFIDRDPEWNPSALDGMTAEQVAIVGHHQPYVGRNRRDAARSPLNLLNLAWNVDKHRKLHTGVASIPNAGPPIAITVGPFPYYTLLGVEMNIRPGSILKPNMVIGWFRIGARPDRPKDLQPEMETKIPAVMTFHGEKGLKIPYKELRQMLRDANSAAQGFNPSLPDIE